MAQRKENDVDLAEYGYDAYIRMQEYKKEIKELEEELKEKDELLEKMVATHRKLIEEILSQRSEKKELEEELKEANYHFGMERQSRVILNHLVDDRIEEIENLMSENKELKKAMQQLAIRLSGKN